VHSAIVHYALEKRKCLLHHPTRYARWMDDTPGERLKTARVSAGYGSTVEAAQALGVSQSTYAQHENGIRGIPKDKAPLYARRFKVSAEWLLYGKGGTDKTILDGAEPTMPIPLLGDVPAGPWREAIRKSHHFIPAPQAGMPPSAYALKVRGDSMDKIAQDGATIVIDPTDFDLFEKRLFVVRNGDGEVTFKQYLERPARLVPASRNPAHKEIPITDRGFEIVGRVIKIILDPDQAALA
jgi:repressor LexA